MGLNEHRQRRLPGLTGFAILALAGTMTMAGCVGQPQNTAQQIDTRLDRSLLEAANDSELQRDHNSALTYYRSLYRRDPGDVGVVVGLSRNLRRLDRANEAHAIVQRALKDHAKDGDLMAELGKIQLAMGEPLQAVETLSQAEAITGSRWDLAGALAVAYDRIQMFDQAGRAYQRALELSPENANILNNMALSLALAGELDRAIATLNEAVALPEATVHMRQNLALLYAVRGDLVAAERLVRRDLPRQIADENMAQYRRIAKTSSGRLADDGRGNAVAAVLDTPVQVKPAPAAEMPAKPLAEVTVERVAPLPTTPIIPEESAEPDAMVEKPMVSRPKTLMPSSDKAEAVRAEKVKPDAVSSAMSVEAEKAAEAEQAFAALAKVKEAPEDRMAGAKSEDGQLERMSLADGAAATTAQKSVQPRSLKAAPSRQEEADAAVIMKEVPPSTPTLSKSEMPAPAMAKPVASSEREIDAAKATSETVVTASATATTSTQAPAPAPAPVPAKEKVDVAEVPAAVLAAAPASEPASEAKDDETATAAAATPVLLASNYQAGYRLQLGSFRSIDRANRLIRMLSDEHPDLLEVTRLGVREASLDNDTQVFRVVSDVLSDRVAASNLCDALKGRDVGCLMLSNR